MNYKNFANNRICTKRLIFTAAMLLFSAFIIISCASAPGTAGESVTGIYAGVIPAADCPGISVVLLLYDNGNYKMTYQYIDRGDNLAVFTGTYTWDGNTKKVTLDGNGIPSFYKAGKNSLKQLDMNGNEITGNLAKNYKLKKI